MIDNLVTALAGGMAKTALLRKLEELKNNKISLEHQVAHHQAQLNRAAVTEEDLHLLFSTLKQHVTERNIPEIKKFIESYVEKVIVYKEHVELILKLKVMEKKNPQPDSVVDLTYGGEGSRTPFRRSRHISFYGCSHSFDVPKIAAKHEKFTIFFYKSSRKGEHKKERDTEVKT